MKVAALSVAAVLLLVISFGGAMLSEEKQDQSIALKALILALVALGCAFFAGRLS
jgi:hypothetical protein